MKKHLRVGGTGTQPYRERIILREGLRRVDSSLFKGQLGWRVPEPGFSTKPGRTSVQVAVGFDSGFSLDIDTYWIDFIREELAEELSEKLSGKIVESFRDAPFDANPDAAAKWMLDFPSFKESDCRIIGHGLDLVYAYTYRSAVLESVASEHRRYPMKVGYSGGLDRTVQRVASQFPSKIAHDAHIQFIGHAITAEQLSPRSTNPSISEAVGLKDRRAMSGTGRRPTKSANCLRRLCGTRDYEANFFLKSKIFENGD